MKALRGSAAVALALVLLVAGCSSSDPTTSEEYEELEQELTQTRTRLSEVTAERDEAAAASEVLFLARADDLGIPPEHLALGTLTDDWYAALERGDGSALDLYVPEGYHLYGDQRFEYDEIISHLSGGNIENRWTTEPVLIAEDDDGRYVVVRGMRNSSPVWSNESALLFEIVTTPEGELRIAQTAWFYDSEWSP